MKNTYTIILGLLFLSVAFNGMGQQKTEPEKAGSFKNGVFTLSFDLRWDEKEQEKAAELFELDSMLIKALSQRDFRFVNDSTGWTLVKQEGNILEITKGIGLETEAGTIRTLLTDTRHDTESSKAWVEQPPYGVNDFASETAFSYQDKTACFVLPGYPDAGSVFLSGTFNNWSTMELPMEKDTAGWRVCIELPPGKHLYKYIVDGRWMTDPNNRKSEGMHNWSRNSVVFCYNHNFQLEGFEDARRVYVAGSFNDWRRRELRMKKTAAGWEFPLFLREGTHAYKFVVNRNWIPDPDNPVSRPDGRGNINSFVAIGDTLYFRLEGYTDADNVHVAGNFNLWNDKELAMDKTETGWQLPYVLAAGNYEYKFVVDGRWITDPQNPFTTGGGDYTNSFMAVKPNHTFVLKDNHDARQVIVTGSFNGWSHEDYKMVKSEEGWIFPLWLRPGRYSYRFIIDGEWTSDPANPLRETNEYGGTNSVLWIDF